MTELKATITTILNKIGGLNKSRRDFFTHTLILFLSIRSRINFLQLSRYSAEYVESSFRLNFEQFFDFGSFNTTLVLANGSGHYIIGFDPSYIRKSGKATEHIGKYWSGCLQRMEWGLEAGVLSAIDIENQTAFHLDAVVSPNKQECQAKDITLMEHYVCLIVLASVYLEKLSKYIAVDAFFAKKEFILPVLEKTHLEIISRLRDDANLFYLYEGPRKSGRGAPQKYDGKMDVKKPDLSKFKLVYQDTDVTIYDIIVYCKFLKRKIRLAYTKWTDEKDKVIVKLYFSTDLELPAWMIVKYYQARFQEEFLFRDAKQFTGLNHCQARSTNKLESHWNYSLTAINIAKVNHYLAIPKQQRKSFSMADVKTICHNQLLIDRFFEILPQNTEFSKNHPKVKELYYYGCIAA
jgi:hypothetical protein